jgi:hypothetical protein
MKIMVLVDHLEHDGKRIEQGAVIDVAAPQAEALIAIGIARRADDATEPKRGKKAD